MLTSPFESWLQSDLYGLSLSLRALQACFGTECANAVCIKLSLTHQKSYPRKNGETQKRPWPIPDRKEVEGMFSLHPSNWVFSTMSSTCVVLLQHFCVARTMLLCCVGILLNGCFLHLLFDCKIQNWGRTILHLAGQVWSQLVGYVQSHWHKSTNLSVCSLQPQLLRQLEVRFTRAAGTRLRGLEMSRSLNSLSVESPWLTIPIHWTISAVDILTGDRRWGQTSCLFYIVLGLQPNKKSDKQDWTSIQERRQRFASRPLLQSFDFLLRLWTQMTQIRFWAHSQRAPAVTEHACNLPSAWGHCWGKTWCQMSWLLPTQWTASKSKSHFTKTSESWLDWSATLVSRLRIHWTGARQT